MKWCSILIFVVLIGGMLGGVAYLGSNADKFGGGFGEPSEISKQITSPSNDLPTSSVDSNYESNIDKIQRELEEGLLQVKSEEEITDAVTKAMMTPEALESCAKLFEKATELTNNVDINDPKSLQKVIDVQREFTETFCLATVDEWKK